MGYGCAAFLYIIFQICDCSKAPSPGMAPVHLLVLIHGMWGNPSNLAELARIARETHSSPSSDGTRLHLLVAQSIQKELTYDGVDWCGEQVVKEVRKRIDDPMIIPSQNDNFDYPSFSRLWKLSKN
jgi:hypothetical protein